MPTTTAVTDWGVATWTAFGAGLATFYSFVPNLIGALLILLVGWGIASLLYALTDKVLDSLRFDALMARTGVDDAINRSGVRIDPSNLVATLVKWTVLLVAFMMAADALNLTQVSVGISAILAYIPNVIAAVAILTLGVLLAGFVSRLVRGAAATAGLRTADLMADLAYWAITIFAALGAIGQLNIAPTLVQTLYTAVIAAIALAGALAFGLGMRDQARDVVAGRALAEQLHPGDEIALEDMRGRIQAIGAIKTLVQTAEGVMSVPNHQLAGRTFRLMSGGGPRLATAGGGGGPAANKHIVTPDEVAKEHAPRPSWVEDPTQSLGGEDFPSI
jgi:small-conductance mechanosensitive channel